MKIIVALLLLTFCVPAFGNDLWYDKSTNSYISAPVNNCYAVFHTPDLDKPFSIREVCSFHYNYLKSEKIRDNYKRKLTVFEAIVFGTIGYFLYSPY